MSLALAVLSLSLLGTAQERRSSITGTVEIRQIAMNGGPRNVRIYLPPRYATSTERYPVLYMLDGQNAFDGATSFIPNEEWRADEAAERGITARLLRPLIIVAIDNAGAARADEYMPFELKDSTGKRRFGGKASKFLKSIETELMPEIDRSLRTRRGPANTGILGSSLGGVFALFAGMTRPDLFGKLGIVSPSLWTSPETFASYVPTRSQSRPRVWLDMGGGEGEENLRHTREFARLLRARGWKDGLNLAYEEDGFAAHNERAWAGRMPEILRFLFGGPG